MIAPQTKPRETAPPKKALKRNRVVTSRLHLCLAVVVVASSAATAYTAARAMATSRGYSHTELVAELKQLQTRNQLLAAEVEWLESPQHLVAVAPNYGMVLNCHVQSLGQDSLRKAAWAKLQNRIAQYIEPSP